MILQLPLIRKWFELTKERVKPEDYREITPYWVKRFFNVKNIKNGDIDDLVEYFKNPSYYKESEFSFFKKMNISKKPFKINRMTLGYPKSDDRGKIIDLEHKGIEIRTGNPDWGADPDKLYFVILHGDIIE